MTKQEENKTEEVEVIEENKEEGGKITVNPETNNLPAFPTKDQIKEYSEFLDNYNTFIDGQLKKDIDYGEIPGTSKPTLLKPGAEKLEKLFFLTHQKECVNKIVGANYVSYTYKTVVYDKNGNIKANCEGSCNSRESKYRYTTVFENKATPEQKKEGKRIQKTSKANKPYFIYQIEKKEVYDLQNTIMKMAQKRSYVGALLEATGSSGRFTQDVEDMPEFQKENRQPINNNYGGGNGYSNYKGKNNYQRPARPAQTVKAQPARTLTNREKLSKIIKDNNVKQPDIKEFIYSASGIVLKGKSIDEAQAGEILSALGPSVKQ